MRKIYITLASVIITLSLCIPISCTAEDSNKLTNEEAQNALKEIIPEVKIIEIRPSPIQGLWEVAVESKGQKGLIYLDASKKYALFGSLLDLKTKTNLTQERSSEINKVDVSEIPLDDALVLGNKDAKHRVIVFDDPE